MAAVSSAADRATHRTQKWSANKLSRCFNSTKWFSIMRCLDSRFEVGVVKIGNTPEYTSYHSVFSPRTRMSTFYESTIEVALCAKTTGFGNPRKLLLRTLGLFCVPDAERLILPVNMEPPIGHQFSPDWWTNILDWTLFFF